MKDHQVQALNYSTHAIESLKELAGKLLFAMPESAKALYQIIRMIERSVKFIMPNCCDLIDPDGMKQSHLDLVRLPYPCVAFEAPWIKESESLRKDGEFAESLSTKRIALCWEADPNHEVFPGINHWLNYYPQGGVFVLAVYYDDVHRVWMANVGGLFFPYENEVRRINMDSPVPESTKIVYSLKLQTGESTPNSFQFLAEPIVVLPEFHQQMGVMLGSMDKARAQIQLDTGDEIMMMVQACAILNCANVTTSEIHPAAAINRKRVSKGDHPLFTYKVLQLSAEPHVAGSHAGKGGSHASPRMHIRRGHPRTLENKTVWIRQTTVNAGSKLGKVMKDYKITR